MKREQLLSSLFFLISAVSLYLFYQIIIPFFVPICWAAVFAILFFPLYERTLPHIKSRGLTALLMCLLIVVLILGPVAYIFAALVNEAADAVAQVNSLYRSGELQQYLDFDLPWINSVQAKLKPYYDISQVNLDQMVKEMFEKVSAVIFNQTGWLITNGTKTVFYFGIMVFSLYYFFKDGETIVSHAGRLMPLKDEQTKGAFLQLREVIQATMYGGMAIALMQGVLGGILFAAVGITSPVFWGAMMAFLSIIPLIGAFAVYVPAGIILMIGGSYLKGLLVIAIGTLVISQVDNVVRPLIIAGRTCLHPLLLFLAILGGIAMFGLLGIVVGPVIAALFVTLIEIFEIRLHPGLQTDAVAETDNEQ